MLRVLDVPGALEARGYPAVEGESVLSVHDPLSGELRGMGGPRQRGQGRCDPDRAAVLGGRRNRVV